MKTRSLGRTGLNVPAIGFGGWPIGGNAFGASYGKTDDATSLAALDEAYALGCRFFDTSPAYGRGHSETLIGQALKGWEREGMFIATRGGPDFASGQMKANFSETGLRASLEASLERLGVGAVDFFFLDNPSLEMIQAGRVFQTLRNLKDEGKARYVGVSAREPQEAIQAIRFGHVDAVQMPYNLFDRRAEKALFDTCAQTGTALIITEPLARGFLGGRFSESTGFEKGDARAIWPRPLIAKRVQAAEAFREVLPEGYEHLSALALRFALRHPAVSVALVGCKTPEQVRENFQASDLPELDGDTLARIDAVYERVFGSAP